MPYFRGFFFGDLYSSVVILVIYPSLIIIIITIITRPGHIQPSTFDKGQSSYRENSWCMLFIVSTS